MPYQPLSNDPMAEVPPAVLLAIDRRRSRWPDDPPPAVLNAFRSSPVYMGYLGSFGSSKPLNGARITCLTPTSQRELVDGFRSLGAEVKWCPSRAPDSASVIAFNGQTTEEHCSSMYDALDWGGAPYLLLDFGGDAATLIHIGVKCEEEFEKTGILPDPTSTDNPDIQILLSFIKKGLQTDPKRYHKIIDGLVGVSEQTSTGVERLKQMQANGSLRFPAINVYDTLTKIKFDNMYGYRHSLANVLMSATGVMIAGRLAVVCGYGDVGKACADALKHAGAHVFVTEIDPCAALRATYEGFQVLRLEDVASEADIFVTATGKKDIIMVSDMKEMKNNAIVCNVGHFNNEIDMLGLERYPGIERITINPQIDRWVFPETKTGIIVLAEGRPLNLGSATGYTSFVMDCSFTNQVIAQLELWNEKGSGKYKNEVYVLPKHLDEQVATLLLEKLGGKLTNLSKEQPDVGMVADVKELVVMGRKLTDWFLKKAVDGFRD